MSEEQLWDDERMRSRAGEYRANPDYGVQVNAWAKVARELRDEYEQRIEELEAENARLRAQLPDYETRAALQEAIEGFEWDNRSNHDEAGRIEMMKSWLDRLDAETEAGDEHSN